eukprot:TRINITY_DN9376_c0_g1_i1.p1 TRINITY_DN9376_c0_g1~~TRINITY_DN9376_c0_g1_i1.p1  ORF type:complete len:129 (-),score=39.78 TRINITY_DN9376_c0_g1_i1:74-460(-)
MCIRDRYQRRVHGVNKMGITINPQESKVLLASHDLNGDGKIVMEEFLDLIFSTNDNMNVDLNKLKFQTNLMEIEPNEDLMSGIAKDAAKLKQIKEESQIKCSIQRSFCLLYTSPSPRDLSTSRMPSSA